MVYMSSYKKILLLSLVSCSMFVKLCYSIPQEARDKGFVYLSEIDPTILVSLRYYGNENFVGKPVDGYKQPVVIMTRQAAQALKQAHEVVKKDGYRLVVYDAYRPQQAVNHFVRWGADVADKAKENQYYPRVAKDQVFDLGYVAKRSGHSRGSTVDLTIIKEGDKLHDVIEHERCLCDGYTIKYLDDGTVDMGSSFDMFDDVSHSDSKLISQECQQRRDYLKKVMQDCGFNNIKEEWWHFTLKNEPYPANKDESYFNFPIE